MAVPQNIEELAHQVRNAIYGRDVRESIASSMEATADVADWSRSVAQAIIDGSFDEAALNTAIENKLTQLEQDYAPNLTALETEVTDARGTETNLGNRLDNFNAQLAQKANQSEVSRIDLEILHRPTKEEVESLLEGLVDATPLFANDISEMTDTTRAYVNLSDGYVYLHDGTDWINTGHKYSGDGLSDHSVGLDQLNHPTLMTEYVKSNSIIDINDISPGKYEVNLVNKGDIYISNGNMFDLFRVPDGTYTNGGITITVDKNTITIAGTSATNLYARLSEEVVIAGNANDAGISVKNYKVPALSNFAYGFYNKTFDGPAGATFNIRSKVSGNITSLPLNTVQPFANLSYNENWGALYLFLPAGTYDVAFDTFLMPNTYDDSKRISPSTKLLDNVRRARLELQEEEYLITSQTGTASPLINVYENLQKGHTDQVANQMYVESHTDHFYFYIKGRNKDSNNYLRYTFEYWDGESLNNGKGWVLGVVDAVEKIGDTFNVLYPVVKAGEWEMAIRLDGRPDFIGCKQHGSELSFYSKFYVDGTEWIPDNSSFWCNEIKTVEKLTMYDPNDEITEVGTHRKFYTIDNEKVNIKQRIEWTKNLIMGNNDVYVAMLPIIRGNDETTSYQITDKAYSDDSYEEIDVSLPNHDARTALHEPNKWTLYSNSAGISASVKSVSKEKLPGANSFIQNSASYNKVYFNYCEPQYNVSNGEVWENEINYELSINL